jgi:hypothetical protein
MRHTKAHPHKGCDVVCFFNGAELNMFHVRIMMAETEWGVDA